MQRLIATTENLQSVESSAHDGQKILPKTKRHSLIAGLLVSGALTAFAAQPAFATTLGSLTLESITTTISNVNTSMGGVAPTVDYGTISVSNFNNVKGSDGNVSTLTYPYTFSLTEGGSTSPANPLFVVEPKNGSGTSTANIQAVFDFNYLANSINYTGSITENVAYYADANDSTDTLLWQSSSNGVCVNSSSPSGECTYSFAIDGQGFSIEMDNETDWDMAEFDALTASTGPTTKAPEPASVAMFGAGLLGLGMFWRRRRQRVTGTTV